MPKMNFDDTICLNAQEYSGVNPINNNIWYALLSDLSENLYTWQGNISFYDLLLIERYLHNKQMFALVRTKYKLNKVIVKSNYHILPCTPLKYGPRRKVTEIRLILDKIPENLLLTYTLDDFVLFDDFSFTNANLLTRKYSDILGKLDALYTQNIDKLSVPIIALTCRNLKNELINIFKRTKINALFSLINTEHRKENVDNLFYNPKIDFLLDKINSERNTIMKEYLQELGVNPVDNLGVTSQYVNTTAIKESSLISKYFSATMNKYRTNFVHKVNAKFPEICLAYHVTVKTYDENKENELNINNNSGDVQND